MNSITKRFRKLAKKKKKAFVAFITAGDPSLAATKQLVVGLEAAGVDIIELGIPFSDPLADGPTIQASSKRALAKKVTLKAIIKTVASLRSKVTIPLVFMGYYNPIHRYGMEKFVTDARRAGISGVIIPDMPYEEAGPLLKIARVHDFATVFLAAPTSTNKRLVNIAQRSRGFIYFVSLTGVTGARQKLPDDLIANIKRLKNVTTKPVCVGFGVSNTAQARMVARVADGVIVGSALIKLIEKGNFSNVYRFAKKLGDAIHDV
jgi:tryptophan synthase alpha chain